MPKLPQSKTPGAIILVLACLHCSFLFGQCPVAPPPSPCTGSEPLVAVDEVINAGTTKWYYGSAATFNSLTMNGGTLIVCGDLTIDKFYMDSGTVLVNPSARFVIGSGIGAGLDLKGNSSLYNYGTLEIQRNLSLQGGWASPAKPNVVINATTASVFKMSNQYFVINNPNSWFVNAGRAEFWGLITDAQSAPGSVCLSYRSTMQMATLINKVANTYRVTSGTACVYVFQFSQFFGALTSSPGLFACLSAGHHSDTGCIPFGCTPNAWGTATVFNNCNSCGSIITLPVSFISVDVSQNNNRNILKWEFDPAPVHHLFYIERSGDGRNFYTLDSIPGSLSKQKTYIDADPLPGINYYRVRYFDPASKQSLSSKIISAGSASQTACRIYPSPFLTEFFVEPGNIPVEKIIVHTIAGRNIPVRYLQKGNQWQVELKEPVIKQILVVQVVMNGRVYTQKILKGN